MIKILFVEDDAVVLANLRHALTSMKRDWDMRFASSAEEALMIMSERPFDVLVSDLTMPGITGMELLSLTQYLHPRIVRVLLSEAGEDVSVVRGARVAHRILRKPCSPEELSIAILRAFELEQKLNDSDLQEMINGVGELPSPPQIVLELNDLLGRPDSSINEISEIIGSDVAMTAKLLQVVNSAYFGLTHHIVEVREAVAYLGLDAVRSLTVAMELLNTLSTGSPLVQSAIDEIHEHSLTVAHIARELVVDRVKANEAFVSALLHDVGLLVVATQSPEKFLELRVQAMRSNLPLTEVELEVVGAHHADIGAYLLDLWGLPYEIVEAVARHHDAADVPTTGLDSVHALHIADVIVSGLLDQGDGAWEHEGELDPDYLERLGVNERVEALTANHGA